jgi:hypothetical protein
MSIELPVSESPFFPQVPAETKYLDAKLYDFLERMRRYLDDSNRGLFDNTRLLADTINSGTSGAFVVADIVSITVVNGIITAVATS